MEIFLVGVIIGLIVGVLIGSFVAGDDTNYDVAKQKVKGGGFANFHNELEVKEKKPKFGFLKRIFKKKKV